MFNLINSVIFKLKGPTGIPKNNFMANNPAIANVIRIAIQFLPFILIIVIFYYFLIRPQNQQQKALIKMINNLKVGDNIITKGGIIGKISSISKNELIIELCDGSKMKILKQAVISLIDEKNK